MNNRFLVLRKALNMTQASFAERISVTPTAVSKIESGQNKASDQTITLIVREFGVNEEWLRTGEGEMFTPTDDSMISVIAAQHGLDATERAIVEAFLSLPPDLRNGVKQFILDVATRVSAEELDPEDVLRAKLDAKIREIESGASAEDIAT